MSGVLGCVVISCFVVLAPVINFCLGSASNEDWNERDINMDFLFVCLVFMELH